MTKVEELKEEEIEKASGGLQALGIYVCDKCNIEKGYKLGVHYCPNCGGKMHLKAR